MVAVWDGGIDHSSVFPGDAPEVRYPSDYGYSLGVYVVWAAVVLGMYPLCLWYSPLKARRTDWWLGYF